jgi:sugar-specific transcriptional regulator TrmB
MDYKSSLFSLGLNPTEIQAYTQLLDMGSGTIQEIVHRTGLKRTTTYSVLENLMQKRLVTLVEKDNKREYFAENPKKIADILEDGEKELRRKKQLMLDALPELASMYNAHAKKPKVRFYEGEDAVKAAFYEPLDLPAKSETLVFSNADELDSPFMHDAVIDFMGKRTAKKILNRSIAEDSPFMEETQKNDKAQYRDMTLIDPKKFPAADRINIYGNKVSIISFKNKMVLSVESESIASTFRSLFELAWIGSQKVGKPSANPYIPPKQK